MKFLAILHAQHEGPGLIREWISLRNHTMDQVFAWELFPSLSDKSFDALIIMGGPMGANEDTVYPWLVHEKDFIRQAVDDGKKILGICLGSQLLADCLGAKVFRNPEPEIGWFPVKKKFFMHSWFPLFDENERINVFHWHGDTFNLPGGCVPLFESEACKIQAFAFEDQLLGLQFHPEADEDLINAFIEHGKDDLRPARYIQSESRMLKNHKLYAETSKTLLFDLLDDFFIV
jgi:GMP synthase-like glutamine amidotransferase